MTARILILGSTGSIGTQAIELISANPERFEVVGLAAGGAQPELLIKQAQQFSLPASAIAVADPSAAAQVGQALGGTVISGPQAAAQLVREIPADTVLNALVGSMGLEATLATLEQDEQLALANKESLVAGGSLVLAAEKAARARLGRSSSLLIPVDSEHSAMAQALRAGRQEEVSRLVLTASGGPFRGWTRSQMWQVTPAQAAAHPTWSMGQMNTLNSATLVNKGLEFIEAVLLFGIAPKKIDVVVHPQSIVHSMVTFVDGCTMAQASPPSMLLPISLALNWPDRVPAAQPALDWSQSQNWSFEPVDHENFPAITLAAQAVSAGGTYPAVYNAANEEAAARFLAGQLAFPQIVDCVAATLDAASNHAGEPHSFAEVVATETWARSYAQELLAGWVR